MSKTTVSISFKMEDGANGLKTLTLQASDLQKIMAATASEAQKLNNEFSPAGIRRYRRRNAIIWG